MNGLDQWPMRAWSLAGARNPPRLYVQGWGRMELRKRIAAAGRLVDRRHVLQAAGLAAAGGAAWLIGGANARSARAEDESRFFRIGTGPTTGNYFTIGGIIANAISNPPGSRPCDKGG